MWGALAVTVALALGALGSGGLRWFDAALAGTPGTFTMVKRATRREPFCASILRSVEASQAYQSALV